MSQTALIFFFWFGNQPVKFPLVMEPGRPTVKAKVPSNIKKVRNMAKFTIWFQGTSKSSKRALNY